MRLLFALLFLLLMNLAAPALAARPETALKQITHPGGTDRIVIQSGTVIVETITVTNTAGVDAYVLFYEGVIGRTCTAGRPIYTLMVRAHQTASASWHGGDLGGPLLRSDRGLSYCVLGEETVQVTNPLFDARRPVSDTKRQPPTLPTRTITAPIPADLVQVDVEMR